MCEENRVNLLCPCNITTLQINLCHVIYNGMRLMLEW